MLAATLGECSEIPCGIFEIWETFRVGVGAIVINSFARGVSDGKIKPAYIASKHVIIDLIMLGAIGDGGKGIRVNA